MTMFWKSNFLDSKTGLQYKNKKIILDNVFFKKKLKKNINKDKLLNLT